MFSAKFHTLNRKKLTATVDADILVIAANGLVQKSADITFPFRQDSNFWYLTGLETPEAVLVIDKKAGNEYIILARRLAHRDQWEGSVDVAELQSLSGIKTIYDHVVGWAQLKKSLTKKSKVATILPSRPYEPNYGMFINPAKLVFGRKLKRIYNGEFQDLRLQLARLRQVKSTEEIKAIQHAVDITTLSLQHAKKQLPTAASEHDISVLLSHEFATRGAAGHAYEPIIAAGANAATIHYEKNDSALENGTMVLLDVGAQYGKYAADISRTWAIGAATDRQKDVYEAVKRVHSYAMGLLKPGVTLRNYEKDVRTLMKKELVGLGLIEKNDTKKHLIYYPHLTSHFLGIDVHDAGDYDAPLEEGVVLTVEPGIYISEERIGVRIEDDVLITKTGCLNLSATISDSLL